MYDTEFCIVIALVGAKTAGCFRRGQGLIAYELNFPLYYTDTKSGLRKLENYCRMEKI